MTPITSAPAYSTVVAYPSLNSALPASSSTPSSRPIANEFSSNPNSNAHEGAAAPPFEQDYASANRDAERDVDSDPKADFLARIEWRKVSFETMRYAKESWAFTRSHMSALVMYVLAYMLVLILPLVPVAVLATLVFCKRHRHREDPTEPGPTSDEWAAFHFSIVVSSVWFIIHFFAFILPLSVGFPAAVFDTWRTGKPLKVSNMLVRGHSWGLFKLILIQSLVGTALGFTVPGFSFLWSILTMAAWPMYVDHAGRLTPFECIKASIALSQRYTVGLVSYVVVASVIVLLGVLAFGIGFFVALPMTFVMGLIAYREVAGVNGVPLSPELLRPSNAPVVVAPPLSDAVDVQLR
jgi:uncharacterized membrane protein